MDQTMIIIASKESVAKFELQFTCLGENTVNA